MQARKLKINEIFFSIQGESTHAGRPCIFVRLMGCPLRCTYCDTEYAFHEGVTKSFDEIFETLKTFPTQLVEITGGEPLAQKNSVDFAAELLARGYEVLIETSGAYPIWNMPPEVKSIVDIKTPGSGENHRMLWDNIAHLKAARDEVKFVVTSRADFDYAVKVCDERQFFAKGITVLLSPSFNDVSNRDLAQWALDSGRPFRFQLQMHKYIWEPTTRGV